MKERARECNVSGKNNRAILSPTKNRFHQICSYTAEQYGTQINEKLATEVRQTIDDTNRKFRSDLRRKKHKTRVAAGQIVSVQNSDSDN